MNIKLIKENYEEIVDSLFPLLKTKHSLGIRDCSLPKETNESKRGLRNKSL